MKFPALLPIVLACAAFGAPLEAETAAHTIAYHSQDIVNIRAERCWSKPTHSLPFAPSDAV